MRLPLGQKREMRCGLLPLLGAAITMIGWVSDGASAARESHMDCFVAGEAGGWLDSSAASKDLERTLIRTKQTSCNIERRSFESLEVAEFRANYLGTKPVILYHHSKKRAVVKFNEASGIHHSFDSGQVKAWLTRLGLNALAEEAAKESIDGYVALEMDAADWSELGATSDEVDKIAKAMHGSASVWSRDSLRYHCGSWTTPLRTVAQILARNVSTAPETTLTDYIDSVRDSEQKGVVNGGIEHPPSDPLGIKAQRGDLPDENFFLTGGELFRECERAAAEATPKDLEEAISWASHDKAQKDDWIGHPQFSFGGSGTGMAFHQNGAELELTLTGTRRWWLSPGTAQAMPPHGYRPDKSQLKWVQESATKLSDTFYEHQWPDALYCNQEAGEVIYIPDAYHRASLNVGETITIGAVARTDDWNEYFAEKDSIVAEAKKYLAPKHVDKDGNYIEGQDLGLPQPEIDAMIEEFITAYNNPDLDLVLYQARMHVRENRNTATAERAIHNALGSDPLNMEINLEYGKWLLKQNGRFKDAIQQWQRIIELLPPTVEPYIFYAKLMMGLGKSQEDLGLSATGLRLVSNAMIAGAQRCQIVEEFKNEIMTKNSHDARLLLGQQLAAAGFLLASFPLQAEKPADVRNGLHKYAELCAESNIVLSVTEEDAQQAEADKVQMIKRAVKEAEALFQATKKPLQFDLKAEADGATAKAATEELAAGLDMPRESPKKKTKTKKKKKKKKTTTTTKKKRQDAT